MQTVGEDMSPVDKASQSKSLFLLTCDCFIKRGLNRRFFEKMIMESSASAIVCPLVVEFVPFFAPWSIENTNIGWATPLRREKVVIVTRRATEQEEPNGLIA